MNLNKVFSPKRSLPLSTAFFFILFSIFFSQSFSHERPWPVSQDRPLRIHFISVGYGDAIFLECPQGSGILIDSGDTENGVTVSAYLKNLNVSQIDAVIITHPHENHFGGLKALLKTMAIKEVYTNGDSRGEEGWQELFKELDKKKIPVKVIKRGDSLNFSPDNLNWQVLHPRDLSSSVNGNSIVNWIQFREVGILLTADIGHLEQKEILDFFPELKRAHVVQWPHHGGDLAEGFIQSFQDKIFVISTGANKWGIPRKDNIGRLKGAILRTDKLGPIILETDGITIHHKP